MHKVHYQIYSGKIGNSSIRQMCMLNLGSNIHKDPGMAQKKS